MGFVDGECAGCLLGFLVGWTIVFVKTNVNSRNIVMVNIQMSLWFHQLDVSRAWKQVGGKVLKMAAERAERKVGWDWMKAVE